MESIDLPRVESRLARYVPTTLPDVVARHRAAVAAVLRSSEGRMDVLLMKRASRPDDRWSGHVSFPGGRAEPSDPTLLHTAMRETREEVGLDLEHDARCLGQLDDVMAMAKGKVLPMVIRPFVFVETESRPVVLGEEAESHFWLPLETLRSGTIDDEMLYHLGPVPLTLPCWRYEGHVVWGLTHKMLSRLLELVSA